MGHGLLKKTVNEFNTALVFAEQATVHEQSQAVCLAIHDTVGTISDPGMPANMSETSIKKHMSVTGAIPC
jgi:hypothetical protein